jgi:hypothetical protein
MVPPPQHGRHAPTDTRRDAVDVARALARSLSGTGWRRCRDCGEAGVRVGRGRGLPCVFCTRIEIARATPPEKR